MHTAESLYVGQVFNVRNQGTAITPVVVDYVILWITTDRVYYKMVDQTYRGSTSLERFLDIVNA